MNADGSDQVNLAVIGDDYSRPSWSPDGTRLAYSWLTACIVPRVAGKMLPERAAKSAERAALVGRIGSRRPRARVRPSCLSNRRRAVRRIGTKVNLVASRGR